MSLTVRILGGLLVLSLIFSVVQSVRLDNAEDFHTEWVAKNRENLIKTYTELNQSRNETEKALANDATVYNKGVKDAEILYRATVDNVVADNKQLRQHWQTALKRASAAETALASGRTDADTGSVSEDVGGFVRNAATADGTIMSLQQTINTYLCQINKEPYPGYECKVN